MLSENKNVPTVNKLIWPIARGSVLHKQLQGFWMTETSFSAPQTTARILDD